MATLTAWRFSSTEGADDAVLRLVRLDEQDQIDVEDAAVLRWPRYAGAPSADVHVTRQGGAFSSIAKKIAHGNIDNPTLDSVKGEMSPGTSALVLLSQNATVATVAKAFEGLRGTQRPWPKRRNIRMAQQIESSCAGSTRASIFFTRMDCRVKPGNDETT